MLARYTHAVSQSGPKVEPPSASTVMMSRLFVSGRRRETAEIRGMPLGPLGSRVGYLLVRTTALRLPDL